MPIPALCQGCRSIAGRRSFQSLLAVAIKQDRAVRFRKQYAVRFRKLTAKVRRGIPRLSLPEHTRELVREVYAQGFAAGWKARTGGGHNVPAVS